MTHDPQLWTYVQVGGIGFIAALLVVIFATLIWGHGGAGGGLTAVRTYLKGRKTYILAGAVLLLGLAKQQGYIDLPTYDRYVEFLTGGAIITFKAALARVEARLAAVKDSPPAALPSAAPATLNPIPPPWPPAVPR